MVGTAVGFPSKRYGASPVEWAYGIAHPLWFSAPARRRCGWATAGRLEGFGARSAREVAEERNR